MTRKRNNIKIKTKSSNFTKSILAASLAVNAGVATSYLTNEPTEPVERMAAFKADGSSIESVDLLVGLKNIEISPKFSGFTFDKDPASLDELESRGFTVVEDDSENFVELSSWLDWLDNLLIWLETVFGRKEVPVEDSPVEKYTDIVPWNIAMVGGPFYEPTEKLVCVIDTGYDVDHPDLVGRVSGSKDFTGSRHGVDDRHSHGTHVLGIISAAANNLGIVGISRPPIYVVKAIADSGSGRSSWIANGIIHCADIGADIISISIGNRNVNKLVQHAVKQVIARGVEIYASAGNRGRNRGDEWISFPAGYPGVIAVGAITKSRTLASFSSWRQQRGFDGVDVVMPGSRILSLMPGGGTGYKSGTSMAAPLMAGLAATGLKIHYVTLDMDVKKQGQGLAQVLVP